MTDKIQKIREEVERMHNLLPITDGDNISVNYADRICTTLEMYIDSMQEEPVSDDLEDAAIEICSEILKGETVIIDGYEYVVPSDAEECFKAGAQWQKDKISEENILLPVKKYNKLTDSINKKEQDSTQSKN